MKTAVTSPHVPTPVGPYSPGVAIDDWVFLAGQGGFDPETGDVISNDVVEQTEQTFQNIAALLQEAGVSLDDVVSCLVHLTDLGDFASLNAVFARQFSGVRPARTTVRADLSAGMLVEITVVAKRTRRSAG